MSRERTGSYAEESQQGHSPNELGGETAHFMTVKREEELQGILEEHLDRRIQERYSQEPSVRTILHCKDIVGHLQRPHVDQRELFRLVLQTVHQLNRARTHTGEHTTVSTPSRLTTFSPSPASRISKFQNLTSLSALPLTMPRPSDRTWMLQRGPECAL